MKIALFHDLPTGGGLSSFYEFVKELSQNHQFDLYAISGRENNPLFDFQKLVKNTYVYGQNKKTEHFISHLDRIVTDLYGLLIEPRVEKEVAEKINSDNYDVALVSHSRFLEAPYLLRYLKIPSVYLCPGPPRQYYEYNLRVPDDLPLLNHLYEAGIRQIRLRLDRQNTNKASVIATHSIFATEAIEMWYDLPSIPTYPGVDPNTFKKTSNKKLSQIVVVGNPEPQKGVDQAIEILSLIPKSIRPKLFVASPRLLEPNPLKRLAKEKKVEVNWQHGLNQKEMAKVYSQSLLTLSVSHREHFGCHVLESLSCETPVIAVKEGGYRENILDGQTGLLIERDSVAFAKAITHLLENQRIITKMGQKARQDILSRWTWPIVTKRLEELLEKTANGPKE